MNRRTSDADDGIDGEQRLVRQEDEIEQSHESGVAEAAKGLADACLRVRWQGAAQREAELEKVGEEEQKQRHDRPVERAAGQPSQPATKRMKVDGSTSERRRLSKIFQREMVGDGIRHPACRTRRARGRTSTARSASRRAPSDACGGV